ncbi:uncharacterized protein BDZ99DRAFT_401361, partial [Mytilinidion resinicola]
PTVVALMGLGGSERSLFLEAVTETPLAAGNGDDCTSPAASVVKGIVNGEQVWLIDTPQSVDSDVELLNTANKALERELGQSHNTVHGLIYLHDITEGSTSETAKKNLATFEKLLSPAFQENIMIVTTLWDMLPSTAQGVRTEAELKAVYSALHPTVAVRRVEDSRDDEAESIYLSILQELINKIKKSAPEDQNPAAESSKPTPEQLQSIVEEKDKELASLKDEIDALKNTIDSQNLELEKRANEAKVLKNKLERAEEQVQQLKTQLEQQKTRHASEASNLRQQLDTERRDLDAKLRKSETDRADLVRQLDDLRRHPPAPPSSSSQRQRILNPSLNVLDSRGEFPLYGAAAGGRYEETKSLLERGADASMCTRYRWTALHWAANNGHANVVQLLLSYDANVNAVSDTGKTPLSMAKTDEVRRLLLQKGAR